MKKQSYGKDIWFLLIESTMTSFILFMPVAYLLFKDLGLNQFQIGLSQFIFMVTLLVLEVPTGYFADRISRKVSNASGDVFVALAVLIYFVASNFWHVVAAEVLFGVGLSLTSGADSALLKAHAEKRGLSYLKLASRMQSLNFVAMGLGAIVGGVLGARNIRWPFIVQAGVFLVSAIIAFRIRNEGEKRQTDKHPLRDIKEIVVYCLRGHPMLAWRIVLSSVLMSSTYLMVWFMTPSFLKAGIDIKYHGLLFAAVSVASILGTEFVTMNKKMKMATPLLISGMAYLILGWQLSLTTIFIFLLTSFARGINTARVKPYIQEVVPEDIQATAISVFGMMYRVASSTLGLLVNFVGNFKLQYGLLCSAAICLLFWALFKRYEREYQSI